uniref:PH domain-containing protein n=1 Tax=Peronospora matthiolae TaxID=2874970 RepID=A0AAV1VIH8_9STRA
MTDSEILRTGVLFKKGSGSGPFGRKNWKPRYFVLTTSRLQYFTFEDGELKGELSLQGCDEGVLEVMPADSMKTGSSASTIWRVAINAPERRLLVAAGTEMEMNDWVDKLVLAFRLNAGQPVLQRASMPASSSSSSSSCLLTSMPHNNGTTGPATLYGNLTTSNSSAMNCNPSIRDFQNFSVPRRGMGQRHSTGMDTRSMTGQDESEYYSGRGGGGGRLSMAESRRNTTTTTTTMRMKKQEQEQEQKGQRDELPVQLLPQDEDEEKEEDGAEKGQAPLWSIRKTADSDSDSVSDSDGSAAAQDAAMRRQLALQQEEAVHAAAEDVQCQEERERVAGLDQHLIQSKRLEEEAMREQELELQQREEDVLEQQRRRKREKHAQRRAEHEKTVKLKLQLEQEQEQKDSGVDESDAHEQDGIGLVMAGADSSDQCGEEAGAGAVPRSSLVGDVKRQMIHKQQAEHQRRREAALKHAALEQQRLKMEQMGVVDGSEGEVVAAREVEAAPREIEVVRRVPVKKQAPVAAPTESFEF